MALATRNLYLVLKARDEASRVIRGFGRELSATGRLANAEALRSRAAMASQRAAYLAATGASRAQIDGQRLIATQMRAQATELERAHRQALRFSNALHTVSSTLVTVGSGAILAGAGIGLLLYSGIKVAQEYGRQVALTATQVDGFKISLQELSKMGLDVAKSVAVPFEEIQPALYNIFSSTNANAKQAKVLLEGFAKTAVAGQVSLDDAARGTIPILNAFNIPLAKVNDILDIQFQLVRKGVGTYGEFSKVFGRVVPSATRAGQNFQTVAAMLAYLTRNGLSAAMASSSAARALDAMSNPKAVASMETLGIKVRDAAGNMLPLETGLKNLQKYLLKLPNKDRIAALVGIFKGAGGTIQARRFLDQILLKPGELDEYIGFLGDMNKANGQFGKAYGIMSDTVAAKTVLIRNKFKVMMETIGEIATPAFKVLLGWISKILDAFNNMSPGGKKVVTIILVLATAFGIIAGAALIFIGLLAGVFAAVMAAGVGFFYLVGAVVAFMALLGGAIAIIGLAWSKSDGFRKAVLQIRDAFVRFYKEGIVPAAQAIKAAWDQYMAPALSKLWEIIETKVWPVFLKLQKQVFDKMIPAFKEVARILVVMVKKGFEWASVAVGWLTDMIKVAIQYYYQHKAAIDKIITALIWLGKWFLKIVAVLALVAAGIGGAIIIAAILTFVATIMIVVNVIVWLIEHISSLIHWISVEVPKAWNKSWAAFMGFWTSMKEGFRTNLATLRQIVSEGIGKVKAFITGIKDGIVNFFKDAGSWLYNAGKNLLGGFVNGIKSAIGSVTGAVSNAVQSVKNFFNHSPAKVGPLAGKGDMFYAGQEAMRRLQQGINSVRPQLDIAAGAQATGVRNASMLRSPLAGSRNVTQNFTINTQEMNPRRQSAELGFLLAGRS